MQSRSLHPIRALALSAALPWILAAAPPAFAQKTWSGNGDGVSWGDAANWVGGTAPVGSDQVLLDNSTRATSYAVQLPAGAVTVSIARLTIQPGAGKTITLTLPFANTGTPGLRAGDATAATDDIVLKIGATLVNASGAGSGNGIEVNSLANGTIRIENGAKYVHNTARSTAGVVPQLSTGANTDHGEFVYDSPGTGSVSIGASGRTYGSLTLARTAGPATYTSTGGSALTVRGHFTVKTGVTYTSSMTAAMHLGGNVVSDGPWITLGAGQPLIFDGTSGPQTVSGTGWLTLNGGGTIAPTAAVTVASGAMLELGGLVTNNGSFSVDGGLQINDGGSVAGNAVVWPKGYLNFFTSNSYVVTGSDPLWSNDVLKVIVNLGGITMNAARSAGTVEVRGPITNANNLTVNEMLEMMGGSVSGAPIYGAVATLKYSGGNTSVAQEWGGGGTVGSGVPKNLVIAVPDGNTVTLPAAPRHLPGNLTIASGSLEQQADMSVGGDIRTGTDAINPLNRFKHNHRGIILDGGDDGEQTLEVDSSTPGLEAVTSGNGALALGRLELHGTHLTVHAPAVDVTVEKMILVDGHASFQDGNGGWIISPPSPGVSLHMEGQSFIDNEPLNLHGLLRIAGSASTLEVANGTQAIYGPGKVEVASPLTVTDDGAGAHISIYDCDWLLSASTDFGAALTTLSGGSLVVKSGGSVVNPPIYANGATLVYEGGNHVVGVEWGPGSMVGLGVPANLRIDVGDGYKVTMPAFQRRLPHDLRISSGSIELQADLTVGGDIRSGTDGSNPLSRRWIHHDWGTIFDGGDDGDQTLQIDSGTLAQTAFASGRIHPVPVQPDTDGTKGGGTLSLGHVVLANTHLIIHSSTDDTSTVAELTGPTVGPIPPGLELRGPSVLDLGHNKLRFRTPLKLVVKDGARAITHGDVEVAAPLTVVNGGNGGLLNLSVDNTILLSSIDFGENLTSLFGNLWINTNDPAPPIDHAPTFEDGSTLVYNTGGTVTHGAEWRWDPLESTCRHASLSIL